MFEEVFLFARCTNFGYFREWASVASAKTGDNAQRGKKKKQLNCSSCCRLFVSRLIKLNANAQMRQLDHQGILNVAMKYTTMVINLKACEYLNDFKVIPPTLTFCFDATAPVFLSQKKKTEKHAGLRRFEFLKTHEIRNYARKILEFLSNYCFNLLTNLIHCCGNGRTTFKWLLRGQVVYADDAEVITTRVTLGGPSDSKGSHIGCNNFKIAFIFFFSN